MKKVDVAVVNDDRRGCREAYAVSARLLRSLMQQLMVRLSACCVAVFLQTQSVCCWHGTQCMHLASGRSLIEC